MALAILGLKVAQIIYRFGWDRVKFLYSVLYGAMLWICDCPGWRERAELSADGNSAHYAPVV